MENMRNIFFWVFIYSLTIAFSQILLKIGLTKMAVFSANNFNELFLVGWSVLRNPYILFGTALMGGSYFLWLAILSWFNLSLAYPLTAIGFIFVAVLSNIMLGETMFLYNYFGIIIIAGGIFLLLYKF
ncbi:hypothetical protein HZB07_01330 [Candidatus Saganbacteria bacterium]|nr:hypothetical protein [Candidatus Saganbacteria bacterium]